MTDSAPKQEPPYGLRMPPDLKARVKAAAEANNRSMNAEIVATLEEKYPAPSLGDLIGIILEQTQYLMDSATLPLATKGKVAAVRTLVHELRDKLEPPPASPSDDAP